MIGGYFSGRVFFRTTVCRGCTVGVDRRGPIVNVPSGKAAAEIPAEVSERLDSADKLSDEDRETIIKIARKTLEEFSLEPDFKSEPEQQTEVQPNPEAVSESSTEPKSGSKSNETKADLKLKAAPKEKS